MDKLDDVDKRIEALRIYYSCDRDDVNDATQVKIEHQTKKDPIFICGLSGINSHLSEEWAVFSEKEIDIIGVLNFISESGAFLIRDHMEKDCIKIDVNMLRDEDEERFFYLFRIKEGWMENSWSPCE